MVVASLLAWVAASWSEVPLRACVGAGPPSGSHLGAIYRALSAALGFTGGFALASYICRQAIDLWRHLLSDFIAIPARDRLAALLGVCMGLGCTALLGPLIVRIPGCGWQLLALAGIAAIYLGVAVTTSMKEELEFFFPAVRAARAPTPSPALPPKLLDTNVLIDGRIKDIALTGFLEGPLYVPGFVLAELQAIADGRDAQKRTRGRRGLDVLRAMQEMPGLRIEILGRYPQAREGMTVDAQLVQTASELGAAIVSNDANLRKVAQLRGVRVLSVNALASAMRPVLLPGEELSVTVVREGKEPEQGVAYLSDGTMVVIERAQGHVGETVQVIVTGGLQTAAGRMLFAEVPESQPTLCQSRGRAGDMRVAL